ncbi:MAG: hypothetical protein ACOCWE_04070 [Bacillota bacterium]
MSKVLAIDPGQDKAGLALTDEAGEPLWLGILSTENFRDQFGEFLSSELKGSGEDLAAIVIGDGTGSEELEKILRSDLKSDVRFIKINEWGSTDEAVKLYRHYETTGLLKKIIYKIFKWRPEEPIDQYAALVLARRYLKKYQK